MRRLYIWGAGDIGRRVIAHLEDDWEIVLVDSNKQLTGSTRYGKKIIGFNEYIEKYSDKFVLIAYLQEENAIQNLEENHVNNYFVHCNLPGEFKEPYVRNYLKEFITGYLYNRADYVLYGLDLYSIIIDGWIYEKFGMHPYILVQENISKDFINKIMEQYTGLNLVYSIQDINSIEEVCVCLDDYNVLKKDNVLRKYCLTDLFDCSDKIESYHNSRIKEVYNLYRGKRCFIIATGPSLRIQDLDILKENREVCISMNSIYYAFDQTDWRPDYYVVSDYRSYDEYKDMLDDFPAKKIFLSDNDNGFWNCPHKEKLYRYHQHYEYYFGRLPKFSDDFSKKSYVGCTVTYTCLQLAVYMGFKEIYLLGTDFSYGGSPENSVYTHFYKEEGTAAIGYVRQVSLAYQSAKHYAGLHDIHIYNATRGGKLEVFERVEFDDLFPSYSKIDINKRL